MSAHQARRFAAEIDTRDGPRAGSWMHLHRSSSWFEAVYDGEAIKVGFNFRYLSDVLNSITEDQVEFQLTDPLSPGVMIGVGSENYRAIIMPMRL